MFKCIYCDEECTSIKNLTQHLNQCLKKNFTKDREQIKTTKYTESETSNKVSKEKLSKDNAEIEDQNKTRANIDRTKDKEGEESRKETKPNQKISENIPRSKVELTKPNIDTTKERENEEFKKETKPNIDRTKDKENEDFRKETRPNQHFFENNLKTNLEETKPKQNVDPEYVCEIMVEEFIKYFWQFDSFCVALICKEQFKKLNLTSEIKYGVIVYGDDYGNEFAESHFWNEIEDKKFDPWKEIELKKNMWLINDKTVYYPDHKLYPLKSIDLDILDVYFEYLVTDSLEEILDLPIYLLVKAFMKEVDQRINN